VSVTPLNNSFKPLAKSRAFVTGIGAVSCLGNGVEALWEGALAHASGLSLDGDGFCIGALAETVLQQAIDEMDSLRPSGVGSSTFPSYPAHAVTLAAARQAMRHAGWEGLRADDGVIFATTTGQIPIWELEVIRFLEGQIEVGTLAETFKYHSLGLTISQVCELLDFRGHCQVLSSACAASTHALALARLWIEQGVVKRCLVGGTELLCQLTKRGFHSFQLLSKKVAAPFDQNRDGINLSEGSGFLCVEAAPSGRPLAVISGGGITSDAYHMTAPDPEGRGCLRAMRAALASAGLAPDAITWVHAHGTGSPHNDLAESTAIRELFGDHGPYVSSTKAIHGHALGASGALESVLCIKALQHQTVLATTNLHTADERLAVRHPRQHLEMPVAHIMKNTLGFGGANGSVILSAVGAAREQQ